MLLRFGQLAVAGHPTYRDRLALYDLGGHLSEVNVGCLTMGVIGGHSLLWLSRVMVDSGGASSAATHRPISSAW